MDLVAVRRGVAWCVAIELALYYLPIPSCDSAFAAGCASLGRGRCRDEVLTGNQTLECVCRSRSAVLPPWPVKTFFFFRPAVRIIVNTALRRLVETPSPLRGGASSLDLRAHRLQTPCRPDDGWRCLANSPRNGHELKPRGHASKHFLPGDGIVIFFNDPIQRRSLIGECGHQGARDQAAQARRCFARGVESAVSILVLGIGLGAGCERLARSAFAGVWESSCMRQRRQPGPRVFARGPRAAKS